MSTWYDIYSFRVDGDPVRAWPAPFTDEAAIAWTTAHNIEQVSAQFATLRNGDDAGFRGATATALASRAVDWQQKLDPTSGVFRDVSSVLHAHADQLSTLRSEATYAVAQAMAAWKLKNAAEARIAASKQSVGTAQADVDKADHNLAWLKTQIAAIAPGSPDTQFRLPKLVQEEHAWKTERSARIAKRNQAQSELDTAHSDEHAADNELNYWLTGHPSMSWRRLREREDDLNDLTAWRMSQIGLGNLADPGWLDEHVKDFVDFLSKAEQVIKAVIDAAIKAFVEALKIVLTAVVVIVAVIVAIVAVVAIIAIAVVAVAVLVGVLVVVGAALLRALAQLAMLAVLTYSRAHVEAALVHFWKRSILGETPNVRRASLTTAAGRRVAQTTANRGNAAGLKNPQDVDLLALCHVAYGSGAPMPAGWHALSAAELTAKGINPNSLHDPCSGFDATVFEGPDGQIVVAFGGSKQLSDWTGGDFGDTIDPGWSNAHSQQREAMALARQVYAAYPGNVTFTGHSLAGDLATVASFATGDAPAVTFNSKGTSLDNLATMDGAWNEAEIKDYASTHIVAYHTTDDPLTMIQEHSPAPDALGNQITLDAHGALPSVGGHGIDNIENLMKNDPILGPEVQRLQDLRDQQVTSVAGLA